MMEKTKKIKMKTVLNYFFIVFIFLWGAGCNSNAFEGISNDDSFQSKLEEARMKLDDEKYSEAVSFLEEMKEEYPDNPDVLKYMSDAYAGMAGLDVIHLLEILDDLDDSNGSGTIDMIGLVLGNIDGTITSSQLEEKLNNIEQAKNLMSQINTPNEDQIVQMGIFAITHLALSIADVILRDQTGIIDEVTLTEAGIRKIYSSPPDIDEIDAPDFLLQELADDLELIDSAIAVLDRKTGSDNDLSEDFNEFADDIDSDGNNEITVEELEQYLESLLD